MTVSNTISPLWRNPPAGFRHRLRQAVASGLDKAKDHQAEVFFRADGVAVPSASFASMARTFGEAKAPCTMAVVPAWLTESRWLSLKKVVADDPGLVCWCQHGWRHVNHEPQGMHEGEFGPARAARDKRQDLIKGFKRLTTIVGVQFVPVFVPPWGCCDGDTLAALAGTGLTALSCRLGAGQAAASDLPDFSVRVDLHARQEPDAAASLETVLEEIRAGLASGRCGVMLHHQRMNQASLDFLGVLLEELASQAGVRLAHMGQLLAQAR